MGVAIVLAACATAPMVPITIPDTAKAPASNATCKLLGIPICRKSFHVFLF